MIDKRKLIDGEIVTVIFYLKGRGYYNLINGRATLTPTGLTISKEDNGFHQEFRFSDSVYKSEDFNISTNVGKVIVKVNQK